MVQLKFLLLILWIVQSTWSAPAQPPPSDYLDIMTVENLTFYRNEWTAGGPKRLQLECFSYDGDKCPDELTAVLCTNNDYRKLDKMNATSLNWTCNLIFNPNRSSNSLYYIGKNDSEVHCEEANRTATERNVIRGSCSITFILSYKWFLAILSAIPIFVVFSLTLSSGLILVGSGFYRLILFIRDQIRERSRNGYSTV